MRPPESFSTCATKIFIHSCCASFSVAVPIFITAGACSIARLFDFAAAPENRDVMTYPAPETGAPVWRCWQIPHSHAELRAKRIAAEKWAELTFGLMGRTPDHVSNFFAGYAAKPRLFGKYADNLLRFYRHARDTHAYLSYAI